MKDTNSRNGVRGKSCVSHFAVCEFVRELEAAQANAGHDYELDFGVNTIEQRPKTAVATF